MRDFDNGDVHPFGAIRNRFRNIAGFDSERAENARLLASPRELGLHGTRIVLCNVETEHAPAFALRDIERHRQRIPARCASVERHEDIFEQAKNLTVIVL